MARVPSYSKTTALVSRALGFVPEALVAGFVPAAQADLAQLVELRRQVIGAHLTWDDARYLAWRYDLGSPGRGGGECWVVKRGDEVLAMLGSERISVLHQGRAVAGLSVMDIAVRPEFEGVGLGVWMAMHLCERTDCVLAIGSNDNSRALVTRVFERLPDRRSYAHLFECGPIFERRWKAGALTRVAAALADWSMALWRFGASLTRARALRIEPLLRFDAGIAALVAQSGGGPEIVVDRGERFLNWRLFENPRTSYTVWAAREGAEIAGYLAVRTKASEDGKQLLVIEDMLVRAGDRGAAVLKALLCHCFEQAAARGCERITVIACHPENERVLRRLGFFEHAAEAETLSVRSRDAQLSEAIAAGVPWHLTGANTDRDD
jgi:ribosomal protein S18 acetylase RimI-like enzyme